MSLVVGNKTYQRFVFDPEDDVKVVVAELAQIVAESAVETAENDEEKQKAKEALEAATVALDESKAARRKINVTYRPLRGEDKAQIEDTIRMMMGDSNAEMRPGTMRKLSIWRAVVTWDATETTWTEATLADLHPDVYESIYAWVSWGGEPFAQDPETGEAINPATGLPFGQMPEEPAETGVVEAPTPSVEETRSEAASAQAAKPSRVQSPRKKTTEPPASAS